VLVIASAPGTLGAIRGDFDIPVWIPADWQRVGQLPQTPTAGTGGRRRAG